MGAVQADSGPVDFAERVQLGQEQAVEPVPDSGLATAAEPSPAGDAGTEAELDGRCFQVIPV
jgi:hypothetical protein